MGHADGVSPCWKAENSVSVATEIEGIETTLAGFSDHFEGIGEKIEGIENTLEGILANFEGIAKKIEDTMWAESPKRNGDKKGVSDRTRTHHPHG